LRNVFVLLLRNVHLLDMAGPVQAFYEATELGADYHLRFTATEPSIRTAQGLVLSDLAPPDEVGPSDIVLVPGMESRSLGRLGPVPLAWLRSAYASGARVCSVCTGAFALAQAGLLDGRACTTHWKLAERLQREHPKARVVQNRLFARDENVVTSAGEASGIDMALAVIQEDHGPHLVGRVAREMVVYLRREGEREQTSIFLEHRTHLHEGVHRVQDWLVAHADRNPTLEELARIAAMSPRNLTRVFRQATGITLKTFGHRIKLQVARDLLHDRRRTLDSVAASCGFRDPRQLRRLFRDTYGQSPSEWRSTSIRANAR
jgi:transcriptional regulator GlxA family with amidase domain